MDNRKLEVPSSNSSGYHINIVSKNTRFLHLSRNAEYMLPTAKKSMGADSVASYSADLSKLSDRVEYDFFSFGYYDRLTYVREKRSNSDFSAFRYTHYFNIEYPYQDNSYALVSDQLIALLDTQDSVILEEDPFEYWQTEKAKQHPYPFLSVIFVTLNRSEIRGTFEELMEEVRQELETQIKKKLNRACVRVFYTLHCADFVVAICSDHLDAPCVVSDLVKHFSLEQTLNCPSGDTVRLGSYVVASAVELPADNTLCAAKRIFDQASSDNDKVEVDLNISTLICNESQKFYSELMRLGSTRVKNVPGTNKCSVLLTYAEFARLYPAICWTKFGDHYASHFDVRAYMCKADSQDLTDYLLRSLLTDKGKTICVSDEHLRFPPSSNESDLSAEAAENYRELAVEHGKELRDLLKKITLYKHRLPQNFGFMFDTEMILIRDMIYTFSDLWYQEQTVVSGYVFYSQVYILLKGIQTYCECILRARSDEMLCNSLCHDLISITKRAVLNINNYNKMLQIVNQTTLNAPNYEIQSKVDTEKYLLAYTEYLMEICLDFRNPQTANQKGTEAGCSSKIKRVYPLISIDLDSNYTSETTLFSDIGNVLQLAGFVLPSSESLASPEFFSVTCPDYRQLANLYHILPIITHEVSHNFLYIDRKVRNETVMRLTMDLVSEKIIAQMLVMESDLPAGFYYKYTEQELAKVMSSVLYQHFINSICSSSGGIDHLKLSKLANLHAVYYSYLDKVLFLHPTGTVLHGQISSWNALVRAFRHLYVMTGNTDMPKAESADLNMLKNIGRTNAVQRKGQEYSIHALARILCGKTQDLGKLAEDWLRILSASAQEGSPEDSLRAIWKTSIESKDEVTLDLDALMLVLPLLTKNALKQTREDILPKATGEILRANKNAKRRWNQIFDSFEQALVETATPGKFEEYLLDQRKGLYQNITEVKQLLSESADPEQQARKFLLDCDIWIDSYYERLKDIQHSVSIIHFIREAEGNRIRKSTLGDNPEDALNMLGRNVHTAIYQFLQGKNRTDEQFLFSATSVISELTPLGAMLQSPDRFSSSMEKAIRAIGIKDLCYHCKDTIGKYQEIFADLGMCAAFQLEPAGYLRFITHMFVKEAERSMILATDFSSLRFWDVMVTISDDKDKAQFWKTLKDDTQRFLTGVYSEVYSFCNGLEQAEKEAIGKNNLTDILSVSSELKRIPINEVDPEDVKLLSQAFSAMALSVQKVYIDSGKGGVRKNLMRSNLHQLSSQLHDAYDITTRWFKFQIFSEQKETTLQTHLKKVYTDKIKNAAWVKKVMADPTVKVIGEHYNCKSYKLQQQRIDQSTEMDAHLNFVLRYYAKSRDTYGRLEVYDRKRPNSKIGEWLNQIYGENDDGADIT